jgi:hypothetical protein
MSNYWTLQQAWDSFSALNQGTSYDNTTGQFASYLKTGPSLMLDKGAQNTAKIRYTPKMVALQLRDIAGTGAFYYDSSQAVPIIFGTVVAKTDNDTVFTLLPNAVLPNRVQIKETGTYHVLAVFPNNQTFSGDEIILGFRIKDAPSFISQSASISGPLYVDAVFEVLIPDQEWEFVLAAADGNTTKGDFPNQYTQPNFIAIFAVISKISDDTP